MQDEPYIESSVTHPQICQEDIRSDSETPEFHDFRYFWLRIVCFWMFENITNFTGKPIPS
jgi:hypothetical protein